MSEKRKRELALHDAWNDLVSDEKAHLSALLAGGYQLTLNILFAAFGTLEQGLEASGVKIENADLVDAFKRSQTFQDFANQARKLATVVYIEDDPEHED